MSQLLQHIEKEKLFEMAMVDIAFEILRETKRPYNFRELMNEIAALRDLTEEQMLGYIAQVYTEVNIDGRYVCIGENTWGLKRWYSTETVEETQEGGVKKKKVIIDDFDDDYDIEEDLADDFEEDEVVVLDEEAVIDGLDIDDDIEEELDEEIEEEELFEEGAETEVDEGLEEDLN